MRTISNRTRGLGRGLARGVAVAAVVAVAGVPVVVAGTTSPALAVATSAASTTSTHARVPQCDNGDLRASYRPRGGAAGTEYGVIRLTNVSDHACRTGGYGGVSYVGGGDGTQVGAPAVRERPGAVRTVVLQPGQRATSLIAEGTAQNYPRGTCRPEKVDGLRVYVPNETRSQYVPHPTTGCRSDAVHLLHQRPYRHA
ncbi:hypothetical protein GCM10023340_12470 [Nocardioides marinquilinus]|uniref:DUF4232 domain-containing protein n=1 Tax=Nocardioides marinquilinus TaxID=1210400 RepID=A0ABP9PD27_9ACTN